MPISIDRANEIRDEEFYGKGFGTEAPIYTDYGTFNDGTYEEPAQLESEESARAQCRAWIDAATVDEQTEPSSK